MTRIFKQPKKPPLSLSDSLPWYKQRWPWLLMIMPCVAVIGCMLTIWIAIKSNDGLVDEEYYKNGLEINQLIARDNQAYAMHLNAQVLVSEDRNSLRIILNQPVKDPLTLKLLHPTVAGYDQEILLQKIGSQLFTAPLKKTFTAIAWEIQISNSDKSWRLRGRWDKKNDHMTMLTG